MQLEWLALTAWSAACEASNSSQLQQAAVIMGASGELWAAHPQPSPATLAKEKVGRGAAQAFMMGSAVLSAPVTFLLNPAWQLGG